MSSRHRRHTNRGAHSPRTQRSRLSSAVLPMMNLLREIQLTPVRSPIVAAPGTQFSLRDFASSLMSSSQPPCRTTISPLLPLLFSPHLSRGSWTSHCTSSSPITAHRYIILSWLRVRAWISLSDCIHRDFFTYSYIHSGSHLEQCPALLYYICFHHPHRNIYLDVGANSSLHAIPCWIRSPV
jgi:hypothetical protein